jgi:hypothetical protein
VVPTDSTKSRRVIWSLAMTGHLSSDRLSIKVHIG